MTSCSPDSSDPQPSGHETEDGQRADEGQSAPPSRLRLTLWSNGPGERPGPPGPVERRRPVRHRKDPARPGLVFPSIPPARRPRIRAVADPVVEGRSLVLEAIRALAIACRAWAAYPSDHPNVTQAVGAAQERVGRMLSAHGSVAVGVARDHLRVGVWTLETAQARALAKALYQRQAAVLRVDRGVQPDELRALVQWLAGPVVPLEPGSPPAGPPGAPGSPSPPPPAARLLGGSPDAITAAARRRLGASSVAGRRLAERPPPQRAPRVGSARRRRSWSRDEPVAGRLRGAGRARDGGLARGTS